MSSARLRETASTRTSTSPGPTSGVGTSRYSITSGPPKRSKITAFMALVLVGQRARDRVFERFHAIELFGRPDLAVGADLIHVGIDLERVAVGLHELAAAVAAGSAPAFEIDRNPARLQEVARAEEHVDVVDFHRQVMEAQPGVGGRAGGLFRRDKRDRVMVTRAAQEHHAELVAIRD